MEIKTELSRAKLRYLCYQMREQGKCSPGNEKIIEAIEKLEHFDGWENFANTWDFVLTGRDKELAMPLKLRWRKFSESKEWEATVDKLATKPKNRPKATGTLKPMPKK